MFTKKTAEHIDFAFKLALRLQELKIAEVFCRFSGHTNQIDIEMYSGKWSDWSHFDDFDYNNNFRKTFYMDFYCPESGKENLLRYKKLCVYLYECALLKTLKPSTVTWDNNSILL